MINLDTFENAPPLALPSASPIGAGIAFCRLPKSIAVESKMSAE